MIAPSEGSYGPNSDAGPHGAENVDWSKYLSWQNVLPPNRPGIQNLMNLRALVAGMGRVRECLILGSTPEYRSEVRGAVGQVTVLDKSEAFKQLSDDICGIADNEVFIQGDWLEVLPKFAGTFDLIVSHYTHGNIPFARRQEFFARIAGALTESGLFVDTVFQPTDRLYDLDQIVDKFDPAPLNLETYNNFSAVAIFQSVLIRELGCVSTDEIYDWLVTAASVRVRRMSYWTERLITPRGLVWDYHPDLPPSRFGYEAAFRIIATLPDEERSAFMPAVRTYISRKVTNEA